MIAERKNVNVLEILNTTEKYISVCAPMVRYSKIQFRNLVRRYNCDLCFSPMIMADSFVISEKARQNEFITSPSDSPLIVQFAANNSSDFVKATNLISPFCDGVDLNCGCPQRWAKKLGVGCILLENPQTIYDIVQETKNQVNKPFTISVKMRLLPDLKKTVEICKQLEKCGVSFITVHGRISSQTKGDANVEAMKLIVENVNCPVIVNGGISDINDCEKIYEETHCQGIMAANGLLTNPTLFSSTKVTPIECIQNWIDICYNSTLNLNQFNKLEEEKLILNPTIKEKPPNLTFQCFHHHLVFMLEKVLSRNERRIFNNLQTFSSALRFLEDNLNLKCRLFDRDSFINYCILDVNYPDITASDCCEINYYHHENNGDFFDNKTCVVPDNEIDEETCWNIFSDNCL